MSGNYVSFMFWHPSAKSGAIHPARRYDGLPFIKASQNRRFSNSYQPRHCQHSKGLQAISGRVSSDICPFPSINTRMGFFKTQQPSIQLKALTALIKTQLNITTKKSHSIHEALARGIWNVFWYLWGGTRTKPSIPKIKAGMRAAVTPAWGEISLFKFRDRRLLLTL